MGRKYILILLLILAPSYVLAIDLSKGLLESEENWNNKNTFLTGGANLDISTADKYPTSIINRKSARSLKFSLQAEKTVYSAGDLVKMHISASNTGYTSEQNTSQTSGKSLFYLWGGGNFFVEVYRLSDEVKDGEFLVASGMAYEKDDISLLQSQDKEFDFSWQVPDHAKPGRYEIRVFPTNKGIMFFGFPAGYNTTLKADMTIENELERSEKVGWKLEELKLDNDIVKLKEKIIRLDAKGNYNLAVPLENLGDSMKKINVKKQLRSISPDYGKVLSEESEEINLAPNESKIISYNISESQIKQKPSAVVALSFLDEENKNLIAGRNYLSYPIDNFGGESLEIPMYFIGNQGMSILGIGLITVEKRTIFEPDSFITMFVEVARFDRLFYETAERERGKEDNIKVNLILLGKDGNKINEAGYAGPSWDRSGMVYKTIKLKKGYDYFKIIGTLSTNERGEVERKEVEYFKSEENKKDTLDKIVKTLDNNPRLLIAVVGTILIVLGISVVLVLVRKNNKNQ